MPIPLRTAVIGVGLIGELHAQACAESALSQLQAVSDVDEGRACAVARRFGVRAYTDFREMLDREALDCVVVATPEQHHKAPVQACAERGLHILLEKPVAPTLAEADDMIAAIEKAGVITMVNFILRFDPRCIVAGEAIARGDVGQLCSMYARRNGTVLGARKYAPWTDLLISTAIHDIDCMLWYADSPVIRVQAEAGSWITPQMGVAGKDDAVMALLRFANGCIATIETSWVAPPTMPHLLDARFHAVGTSGVVSVDAAQQGVAVCTEARYAHPDAAHWPVVLGEVAGNLRAGGRLEMATCFGRGPRRGRRASGNLGADVVARGPGATPVPRHRPRAPEDDRGKKRPSPGGLPTRSSLKEGEARAAG